MGDAAQQAIAVGTAVDPFGEDFAHDVRRGDAEAGVPLDVKDVVVIA